jgi:hypothetical protein
MMLITLRLHERKAEPFTLQLNTLNLHLLTWHSFGRLADHLFYHDHKPPKPLLMRPLSDSCSFFMEVYMGIKQDVLCILWSLSISHSHQAALSSGVPRKM